MKLTRFSVALLAGMLSIASVGIRTATGAPGDEMPITTASKEALALFERARDRQENVEIGEARALYDQAIAKDPSFAMAHAGRAAVGGGYTEVRGHLEKAIALVDKVSPGERHWILAVQAQIDNNPAARQEQIDALLKMFPKDKHVHLLAGNVARARGDEREALEHFKHAVAIDRSYAPAYNSIGYSHVALGDLGAAEEAFKKYIALRPDYANPYDSYAELLQRTGRFEESTAQYQKALEKDPSFVNAIVRIGDNHLFKGDGATAREWYRKAYEKAQAPGDRILALNATLESYTAEGKTEEAVKAVEELRRYAQGAGLAPAVVRSYLIAALIEIEAGDLAGAKQQLDQGEQALAEAPLAASAKEAARIQQMIARARLLSRQGDSAGATALLAKAQPMIQARKDSNMARELEEAMAFLALDRKQYDSALEHFAKGNPADPYVLYYTALTHEAKGDGGAAARLYAQAANWNQPGLGYAIVRARALKKAMPKPATESKTP